MFRVDLNSDMGESFGAYRIGNDEGIIQYVTSANIACGWHAGDPMVMDRVVRMAKERGVAVGAHPGYPDIMGFGRRKMILSPDEIKNYVKYQIGSLWAFAHSYALPLQHVAPHGALGNICQYDKDISRSICEAVFEIDPQIRIFYCAGAVLGQIAEEMGLPTAAEIFADRAYMDDLSLVPRSMEGAMITDETIAIQRCVRMIKEGKVTSINGKELDIKGDTLCVHGDGAKALAFVEKIRTVFVEEGIEIRNFGS
ncbi:MAG: LamB/YcsF family protein [Oscillospiraceae bacterium]|nr:LamB/YcsF family protein [Oscillospiraceae bacterium]